MDIVYASGEASARDVQEQMADAPTYATVRTLLRVLMEKGQLKYRLEGRSYIYSPSRSRQKAARSALRRLLDTFYAGSLEEAVAGLLQVRDTHLDEAEIQRLETLIRNYKKDNQTKPR